MTVIFGVAPALPLHTAGKYVAAAYIVFVLLLVIYVGIMATRLSRTEREVNELLREVRERRSAGAAEPAGSEREREAVS